MKVLVTRPQPDAGTTAARLAAAGHSAVVDPMLRVEPAISPALPQGAFDAVVLTSVNGARTLLARPERAALSRLPLFAVGWRTAEAAAPIGFARTEFSTGTGAALAVDLIAHLPRGARVLHVAGEDRAVELAPLLATAGIEAELFVIYRAVAATALLPATIAALQDEHVEAAFHFSPRTAATLAACARAAGVLDALAAMEHLCFSENVAAPLRTAGARARVAARPDEDALFALLDNRQPPETRP